MAKRTCDGKARVSSAGPCGKAAGVTPPQIRIALRNGTIVPVVAAMRTFLPRLAIATTLAIATQSAHAQIVVDREMVSLNPSNSAERTATLMIRNAGAMPVAGSVQLEDWDVDAQGASHWRKQGDVAGSCGKRVAVSPSTVQLAPGETHAVRISLEAHAQFAAECWSAAVVRVGAPNANATDRTEVSRTTVPLYVTPSGLSVDGELSDMYVKGDSLEVVFRNTGKLRARIVGEVQVQSPNDSVVTTVPLEEATVLMGATRHLRVPMPKLPRGTYVLMAIVDFGGDQLTTVQAALEMK